MPIVLAQDSWFDELKAAIDAQAALIATTLVHKEKEPIEVTKWLCPLVDEVYFEMLPEKYKW